MRPFPVQKIIDALKGVKAVGVLEKDVDHGFEGVVYTNVNSALMRAADKPATFSFIAGLGGRSILKSDIENCFAKLLRQAAGTPQSPTVEFVKLGCE